MEHTKGPWTATEEVVGERRCYRIVALDAEQGSRLIARTRTYTTQEPEQANNARLLAAAPALYQAALKAVGEAVSFAILEGIAEATSPPSQELKKTIRLPEALSDLISAILQAEGTL